MCLILLAIEQHPEYPLILAANRDEFYARPSKALDWWPEDQRLLGGQDLESSGSWLGISRSGRIAAVTNYREAGTNLPQRPSRGGLVRGFLQQKEYNWQEWIDQHAQDYNGFNLLYGPWDQLNWCSNRSTKKTPLRRGLYGICNALLDTPWPKVTRAKSLFEELIKPENFSDENLLQMLQDPLTAEEEKLPDTGIGLEWEKRLSSIFIRSEHYGTRASSVITIDTKKQVRFTERSWHPNNSYSDKRVEFRID